MNTESESAPHVLIRRKRRPYGELGRKPPRLANDYWKKVGLYPSRKEAEKAIGEQPATPNVIYVYKTVPEVEWNNRYQSCPSKIRRKRRTK